MVMASRAAAGTGSNKLCQIGEGTGAPIPLGTTRNRTDGKGWEIRTRRRFRTATISYV